MMSFPAWFDLVLCERLTLTLLHFLWQGTLIAVCAAMLNRLMYRTTSQSRYVLNVTALIVMACCLPVTFSQVSVPTTVSSPAAPVAITLSQVPPQTDPGPTIPEVRLLSSAGQVGGEGSAQPESSSVASRASMPPQLPGRSAEVSETVKEVPPETLTQQLLRRCAPYVTTVYLIGVLGLVMRLMRGAWLSRQLIRRSTAVTEPQVLARLQTQTTLFGLRVLPAMKSCADISVPVVIGLLRPVILLPMSAMSGLNLDQLQAVIAHELAHIRRYDLLVNVLQRVIESLLFFHPSVWWVSRQIANEREQACDELVLSAGLGRVQYADALVKMAELSRSSKSLPATALAATGSLPSAFKRRVMKVLQADTSAPIRISHLAAVMSSLALILTISVPLLWSQVSESTSERQFEADPNGDATLSAHTEIKVGMTFDEVIRIKGRHYRPQHGMGAGQLFLNYDDLCIGVENHPIGNEGGKVFRIDPVSENAEFYLGSAPYADAAHDEPIAQPPAPESRQPRIELIGLTYDKAEKTEAWQPNGQPMPLPEWAKSLPQILDGVLRQVPPGTVPCVLFEFHGLRRTPSIHYHHSTITTGDSDIGSSGGPYRQAAIYISEDSEEPDVRENPLKVSVSDEPWGPWQTITKQGRIAEPVKDDAVYQAGYELISIHGFRPLERNPDRSGLVLRCPANFLELYDFEIQSVEVMPLLPESHREQTSSILPGRSAKAGTEANPITETEYDVDPDKIDHIRFRIRPYRHQFTFENVNFAPSQNPANYTQFESVYTKLEHDMPKPEKVALKPPLFYMPVVDAQTNQPVTNGKVTVRWSFDRSDLATSVRPLRHVFDLQEEFDLSEQGTFPIRIPAGMEDANLQLQTSIRHPGYVIAQSFGVWPLTREMAADPALTKEKLLNRGAIILKRGYEVSGLVTDSLDQPVAGVRVYAAMQMPEYMNMPPHAVTDAQGRYKFRVPSYDEYWLMFVPRSPRSHDYAKTETKGYDEPLRMPKFPLKEDEIEAIATFVQADRDKSAVETDKPADITAQAQMNLVAQSIPIREEYGEHPVVKLQSGTRIVGIVRDSAGKPLPNVVVQANGSDSVYTGFPEIMSRVVTDAEGRYELPAQKLGVDVRVARLNALGGWSEPTRLPADVYLPEFVTERWGKLREGEERVFDVNFAPVQTVILRARAYTAEGQPDANADIALIGRVPVPGAGPRQSVPLWRRRFQKVPGEVGLYELKAPHGLFEARIDLTNEGLQQPAVNTWTREVREAETLEGPRTNSAWAILDYDDDSIIVGEPAVLAQAPPNAEVSDSEQIKIRELNLRDDEVKEFVLETLRTPYKPNLGGGSWQLGAHEGGIAISLRVIPQRELVIQALLEVVNHTEESTSQQYRIALCHVAEEAPEQVLPILIQKLKGDELPSPNSLKFLSSSPYEKFAVLAALKLIGERASDALPALIENLSIPDFPEESNSGYRGTVAEVIGKVAPTSMIAVDAIANAALKDDDSSAELVYHLARYGELARPHGALFIKLLDSEDKSAAIWAAEGLVLSGFDPARGYDELFKHLQSGSTETRGQAATALAALGSRATGQIPRLQAFLNDPDPSVVDEVKQAIERIQKDDRIRTHAEEAAQNAADKPSLLRVKPAAQSTPPQAQLIFLKVVNAPRRQILELLAENAGLEIFFDEPALAETDIDLDKRMTLELDEVPLWLAAWDVCELPTSVQSGPVVVFRKNTMVITTIESEAKRPRAALPEWLTALQSRGVGAATDDDGQVTNVGISGKELTNEMLARLPELKHLKELTICPRGPATDEGLAALAKLHSLETLNISSRETQTDRADEILFHVKLLPNLKSVSFHESGVSDKGIAHLAEAKSIERISIYQDGGVSDRGIELIAGMSQLKGLSLTQYVFLQDRPKMEYSAQALAKLSNLTQLESLILDGIDAPATLQFPPGLQELTLTGMQVDDAMAARIAACSNLKNLSLRSTAITDEGLRLIASGTKLTSLSLWETPITDAGMAHLTTHPLRTIELRDMRLGDATFNHIAQIKTLSRLTIWAGGSPRVSPSVIRDPNDRSPILNTMTVGGMRVLKDLPQLRSLYLFSFPNNADYMALGELKQLRELSMLMCLTDEADLEALEAALPKTQVSAGTGAGMVEGLGRRRK